MKIRMRACTALVLFVGASLTQISAQPSRIIESQDHMAQGMSLQNRGDVDGAIAEYRMAINLDPKFAKPHNNLGNALSTKGDYDGALREYRTAIRLDPFYKLGYYNLALELKRRGNTKEAAQNFVAACPAYHSAYCPATSSESEKQCQTDLSRCYMAPYGWEKFDCIANLKKQGCKVPHGIL